MAYGNVLLALNQYEIYSYVTIRKGSPSAAGTGVKDGNEQGVVPDFSKEMARRGWQVRPQADQMQLQVADSSSRSLFHAKTPSHKGE
jgi:hypothetical protein